jgi:hypothetical protein
MKRSKLAFTGKAHEVPGRVEARLNVFQEGDPGYVFRLRSGRVIDKPGTTLREFRRQLGGDEGYVTDTVYRKGEKHHVSLKPWEGADPDRTRVMVSWRFIPEKPIRPEFRDLFPASPPPTARPPRDAARAARRGTGGPGPAAGRSRGRPSAP